MSKGISDINAIVIDLEIDEPDFICYGLYTHEAKCVNGKDICCGVCNGFEKCDNPCAPMKNNPGAHNGCHLKYVRGEE